jgi:serine/threonine protein phosphatase PrpC
LAARSSIGNGSRHAHSRNEDFAALDVVEVDGKPVILAAVADGLTTCTNPPRASEVACKVAIEKLRVGALGGEKDSAKLVQVAMEAAQAAVIAVMPEPGADSESLPPSAAIVMAYIKNDEAYLGWCGDSRIYAIERNADGAYAVQQLTRDHTMLNEMVDSGQMTVAEACARLTVHELHTMVQCLGEVPEGDVFAPSYRVVKIEPSMVGLFLATDGAWNDEHPMDARESALFPEDYAATAGNALAFAEKVLKRASGEDNVTIAVILF